MGIDAAEKRRLGDAQVNRAAWKQWGPYLSERQWGTVREDYSENDDAWNYFSHDRAARSRAYRWDEDGLGEGPGAEAATARALHDTQGPGFETRR